MGKYIKFEKQPPRTDRKTETWYVMDLKGDALGIIKWFSAWRCYGFFPCGGMVFEQQCLRDLAAFCEIQTKEQRK